MTYDEFLNRVIDDGIAAAERDYRDPVRSQWLAGSVEGFERCRRMDPLQLLTVYESAAADLRRKLSGDDGVYTRVSSAFNEIEWVCNVVSAALRIHLVPGLPTARGVLKAADVLGVESIAGDPALNGRSCGCDPGVGHRCSDHEVIHV